MHKTYTANNFNILYKQVAYDLYHEPDNITSPRNLKTRELFDVKLIITNPYDRLLTIPERKMDLFYYVGELCFYLSGSNELNFINKYSKFWNKISDDGKTVNSAYGKKIFAPDNFKKSQFNYCLHELGRDINSRKAVITLRDSVDAKNSKDNICTLNLQFIIRDNKLHLINNMRSNDIIYGLTYDVMFFTFLQEMLYIYLKNGYNDLEMGSYIHNVTSLHVYERHFNMLQQIISSSLDFYNCNHKMMPKLNTADLHCQYKLLSFESDLRTANKIYTAYAGSISTPLLNWCAKILAKNRHRYKEN